MRGYSGKLLEVDLTTGNIKENRISEGVFRQYIGGRGLAAKILWDRLGERWEEIDPLGPENILLMLTGPLTGFIPGGRICISGKSPQSNGMVGSTIAGEFPIELKCAGYDGIIFTGAAEKPSYLLIKDSDIELKDASHIWGKGAKETVLTLVSETRKEFENKYRGFGLWKEPSILYIGPSGEKLCRTAAVTAKWSHAAGYGGYGAVMGSKKLKAVVVKGTGPLPEVYDLEKTIEYANKIVQVMLNSDSFRRWGTGAAGYTIGAELSSEPVMNWQEEWHDERSYGVDKFELFWVKKFWGDFGCALTCLKLAVIKSGAFKGAITDNPDYENQAYLGTNLGIFDPQSNIYLTWLADELGFCGIQVGNALAFAAELYQRGILTRDDLGGIDLRWGDAKAFADLMQMIARREGIGDVLAEGTYRAALKISKVKGIDVTRYAVTVKGIAVGAHGIRSGKDYPHYVSYPCSVQGGDHTSVAYIPIDHLMGELGIILCDSAIACMFALFNPANWENLWALLEAVTGWKIMPDEWFNVMARRILHIQRAMLLLGGPDLKWNPKIHDSVPSRWYEPLLKGPYSGKALEEHKIREEIKEYYRLIGWDENGIPTSEELKRLGLEDVDRKMKILREQYGSG
ncbi:MAG: aldehyde ferredoxin oxidoreductase C-terminal domain-containing protein [Candidatus Bathyarchaeia archaeon]|nr:aldehyde ferredoxin oxidoreductase [Candidatus Bathyarchaeota archaeon]